MDIDGVNVTVENLPDATVGELKKYVDYVRQKIKGTLTKLNVSPSEEGDGGVWFSHGKLTEKNLSVSGASRAILSELSTAGIMPSGQKKKSE